ncbi:MAG: 4Fe-4S dicluster domain-containing protein [Acidimicrobiales bacterium]
MTETTTEEEPLTPMPIGTLLERIAQEWGTRQRIFDLPTARFFDVSSGPDLGADFLGRPIATPVGPAAGPHTQLAQNIVLGWLAGGRLFELKTVQILDDLVINRPCIDMETVGFNIEWSQELKVEQSLLEYRKAALLLAMLGQWDELRPLIGDPGAHVFDLSVGYDLEGISTPKVAAFIDGMRGITDGAADPGALDELRRQAAAAGGPWAELADVEVDPCLSDTLTLSTFHGCPPEQIEAITKHLIEVHDLNVIVKLNPTLLGHDRVQSILHDTLGHTELRLQPEAFDADLQFDRGIELIGELQEFAAAHDKAFGVKLTNTLIVENHKGFMPDPTMYLSGPPLHVLAMTLLGELTRALPGQLRVDGATDPATALPTVAPIQVSWSAGIDRDNLADSVGLGLVPVTICSDLLKPGGYGRMALGLKKLQGAITESGATDLAGFVAARAGSLDGYVASLYAPDSRYRAEATSKLPRSVDHDLEMWGCVACNFCVTVCPNDAFIKLPSPIEDHRWEYLVMAESCNECGNCLTFCPENGDPAQVKPKLFLTDHRFAEAAANGDDRAFLLGSTLGDVAAAAPGAEEQVATLASVLAGEQGLPVRAPSEVQR